MIIEECTGTDSNNTWLPVRRELESRRGQTLTISIDDNKSDNDWAYIRTTGFDVIRQVEAPVRNLQLARNFADWEPVETVSISISTAITQVRTTASGTARA